MLAVHFLLCMAVSLPIPPLHPLLYLKNKKLECKRICCNFLFSDIDLPNEQARLDILKIHAGPITKHGEIGKEISYFVYVYIW